MLEQIFGSKTRVKLMKLFLDNPDKSFFVRELTRATDSLINSVRRELANLVDIGLIVVEEKNVIAPLDGVIRDKGADKHGINVKKYYTINKHNLFKEELEALFNKDAMMLEKKFAEKLKNVGKLSYLALSGILVDNRKSPTDLVAVGQFDKSRMQEAIKNFEGEIGRSINYTIMDLREYKLRKDIADRFLEQVMEDKNNLVIVNELDILESL